MSKNSDADTVLATVAQDTVRHASRDRQNDDSDAVGGDTRLRQDLLRLLQVRGQRLSVRRFFPRAQLTNLSIDSAGDRPVELRITVKQINACLAIGQHRNRMPNRSKRSLLMIHADHSTFRTDIASFQKPHRACQAILEMGR